MPDPQNTLFEDLLEKSGLDRHDDFLESIKQTPNGFVFTRSTLGPGCMAWVFFGLTIPFVFWVYPAHEPPELHYFVIASLFTGWFALAWELFHSTRVIAQPGLLVVETMRLGFRRRRTIDIGSHGLEILSRGTRGNAVMQVTTYDLRSYDGTHPLRLSLDLREAKILKALIEHVVLSSAAARPPNP